MMQSRNSLFFLLMALPALLLEVQMTAALAISPCGLNQHYDECGSACPSNCFDKIRICIRMCIPGCFCDEGYVFKDAKSGVCVRESACQRLCPENSEYQSCGSGCDQRNCKDELNDEPPSICTRECVSGCFCKPGYVYLFGTSGPCVLSEDCPPIIEPVDRK
ncbi:von Willebrand factor-like [Rhinatrema bivittatum]|uniref:von Willebrand factor-like n=1 Tax=Rhinatrema bivittatum TaxID=194408 RepID=UPI00112C0781|nr:von Willebrand factor-like [Rhinatrema bivittatum]